MLYIRQAAPRAAIEESSLPKIRRTVITGRDLVRAVSPTEEADVPDDEVLSPRVREGDVLVPHVARQLIAPVAQDQDVGAVLSSSVGLIRPDSAVLDPWYLAGLLSSSDSSRQAARMASILGDTTCRRSCNSSAVRGSHGRGGKCHGRDQRKRLRRPSCLNSCLWPAVSGCLLTGVSSLAAGGCAGLSLRLPLRL